jgi:hypothetical protein
MHAIVAAHGGARAGQALLYQRLDAGWIHGVMGGKRLEIN